MPELLDIPEVRARVSRLSVDEYHRLDEFNENHRRTELIRGIVIEKMSKSPLHSAVAKRLYDLIARSLPQGLVARREDPLTLKDSEPEPDVAVVSGSEADFFKQHPQTAELVFEVAVRSVALDRENASLYAEAGIKEYCVVLAQQQQLEVYCRVDKGRYLDKKILVAQEVFQSLAVPSVRFRVDELFRA
ncbi:MAG TPA: Uma2 family endonuclease [Candidatus Dormibacteraeota bacterium]|nr:Uma2 family endonuclease [Candidatus Dormibacteraeota bacterium]